MIAKNTAGQGIYLYAYDVTNKVPKTGDAANITGSWSLDGGAPTSGFGTAHPTEIGGGIYWQPLAQGETNGAALALYWASATSGVQIDPALILTVGTSMLDPVVVETGLNARQALSIIAAACSGTGGTVSNVYKGAGVATTRIAFTASAGERSAVTLSPPA
jgi:hypothetical protein